MTYPISGNTLGTAICNALNIDENAVSRVIIDCLPQQPARVYVEYIDNSPLLEIDWPELLKSVVPKSSGISLADFE